MIKRFIATVQIVIEADSQRQAEYAVENILYGQIVGWKYLEVEGQPLVPTYDWDSQPPPLEAFRPQPDQVIQIYVASGVVAAVGGMPKDWDFEILEEDSL